MPLMPQRVLTTDMFSTPTKPYILPSYDGGLAKVFAEVLSPILLRSQSRNARVLAFVDVEAKQDDSDIVMLVLVLAFKDALCQSLWIPYIHFWLFFFSFIYDLITLRVYYFRFHHHVSDLFSLSFPPLLRVLLPSPTFKCPFLIY